MARNRTGTTPDLQAGTPTASIAAQSATAACSQADRAPLDQQLTGTECASRFATTCPAGPPQGLAAAISGQDFWRRQSRNTCNYSTSMPSSQQADDARLAKAL